MSDPKKKQNEKKKISFEPTSGKCGTLEAEKIISSHFSAIFVIFPLRRVL